MIPEILPYHSYDPDGRIFVQRDGSLGLSWELRPPECEVLSEASLGQYARRIESLLGLFPEGSAVQVIVVVDRRLDVGGWVSATRDDAFLRDFARRRVCALEKFETPHEGAVLSARSLRLLLTWRVFPRWERPGLKEGWKATWTGKEPLEERFQRAYRMERRGFLARATALESMMAQVGLGGRRMDLEGLRAAVFRVLNPTRALPCPADDGRGLVGDRLALEHIHVEDGVLRMGEAERTVYTVREAPLETWAGMLPLESIPEGMFVFNIDVCSAEEVRRSLAAKKRLAFCQLSGGDPKADVAVMKDEVERVSAEVFTEGARVYAARMHAVVRPPADGLRNALARSGMETIRETVLAASLFFQCLPLAYDPANDRFLRRARRMLGLNLTHLLPLYGALRGTASPDLLLLNRRGEPVTFSFFDSTVAPHGIVAGVSGSGKSVLANQLILSAVRRGARVFVLDRGNSYRRMCEMLGGTYVAFDLRTPLSLNPCGRGLDDEKKTFLTDIVCEMAGQGLEEPGVKERSLAARAIARAFRDAGDREVVVSDIVQALENDGARDLALCLEMFAREGPYAGFFDRPCALEERGPLIAYELGDVAKRRDVGSVLLMALIHRITEYARAHIEEPKYLIVDEAWTLLKSATTARFLEDVLRTYRKLNAAAIMVTQQVTDFEGRTGEAIRANAPNRLFLQQTPETVLAMEKLLDLTPEEKALLSGVKTAKGRFSEMLVLSTETRGVARLVPDALSYWISTTDPAETLRLEALARERGGLPAALREAAGP